MNIYNYRKSILGFLLILLIPAIAISAEKTNPVASASKNNSKISKNQLSLPQEEDKAMKFISPLDQNTLERQFKDLMASKGLTYRKDKDIRKGSSRRLYFEKDNLAIDIVMVALKSKGTEVVMTRYNKLETVFDLKETVSAVKNPSVQLPNYKQDNKNKIVSYKPVQDKELGTSDITMDIPFPAKSELLKEKVPDPFIGVGGSGQVYQSEISTPKDVENFYRLTLTKMGFRENKDRAYSIMSFKRLRFESNNMAIELFLSSRGENGSRFIVVKYMDKDGVSKVEANPLYMAKLPENDNVGGSDLANVPRPINSVRQSGGTENNSNRVSYIAPIDVRAVRDFYKEEMPPLGWKLSDDVSIRENDDKYAKDHNGVGFVRSVPVGTKMDLRDIIRDSYALEFKSNAATVQIMIYPNFTNPAAGSMVDIEYVYPKNQEKR